MGIRLEVGRDRVIARQLCGFRSVVLAASSAGNQGEAERRGKSGCGPSARKPGWSAGREAALDRGHVVVSLREPLKTSPPDGTPANATITA